jgi:hypothetical protein
MNGVYNECWKKSAESNDMNRTGRKGDHFFLASIKADKQ